MGKSPSLLWSSDTHLLALFMHDLLSFWSFITSHPLHFAYILFFSPYITPLLSFLYPLLLSTSLLVLAVLTVSQHLNDPPSVMSLPEFFGNSACSKVLDILKAGLEEGDDTRGLFEQFSLMVLPPIEEEPESQALLEGEFESEGKAGKEVQHCTYVSLACEVVDLKNSEDRELSDAGYSSMEITKDKSVNYSIRRDELEAKAGNDQLCKHFSSACEVEELKNSKDSEFLDAGHESGNSLRVDSLRENVTESSSEIRKEKSAKDGLRRDESTKSDGLSQDSKGLQRDWSMRREKEWKRTLACKLFEERMTYKLCEKRRVIEGCEDMDLLWEAYEANSSKSDKAKKKGCKEKKDKSEEEEQEQEEEAIPEQLCCLQALSLSSGKFNLGVGRPNLAKISKVFKGLRFLRREAKQSKKG